MNTVQKGTWSFPWCEDLKRARDVEERQKFGFDFVLSWYERWRIQAGLPPAMESARRFWKDQVQAKARTDWQLDQWAQAFRWYGEWLRWAEQEGIRPDTLEERVRVAVNRKGAQRGLAVTTRSAYQAWAGRFARTLEDDREVMSPERARDFLAELVSEGKASFSTQKQALNALAFFFKEVCGLEEVDLGVKFRKSPKRMPVVLNLKEVAAVLANLPPSCQLAAKLQYGSGLRIRELVNLRIKDVDLDGLQVTVRGGKGDRDRVTTLPRSLVEELREWKTKVRELHECDRANRLPGVAMPKALERKWPRAGEQWKWMWWFPSESISKDPDSDLKRRHHLHPGSYGNALREAA